MRVWWSVGEYRWTGKTSLTEKFISMIYYLEAHENGVRCKKSILKCADNLVSPAIVGDELVSVLIFPDG